MMEMGVKHMHRTPIFQLEFYTLHIAVRTDMQQITLDNFAKFNFGVHKYSVAIKSCIWVWMFPFKNLKLNASFKSLIAFHSRWRAYWFQVNFVPIDMSIQVFMLLYRRDKLIKLFGAKHDFLESNDICIKFVYIPL